jgi:hypothetical protein
MALGITAYNFTRMNLAIGGDRTPAQSARLTDHVWTMAELVEAALAAVPEAPPTPVRLALRPGTEGAARELPGGRGWLRVVGGAATSPEAPAAPEPPPEAPPAVETATVAPSAPEVDPRQLNLFEWKPRALPMGQLSLFDV